MANLFRQITHMISAQNQKWYKKTTLERILTNISNYMVDHGLGSPSLRTPNVFRAQSKFMF